VPRFVPNDWRGEGEDSYPRTFEGDEDRWRDLNAWRRWNDAWNREISIAQ
jgi:hypothetical protein